MKKIARLWVLLLALAAVHLVTVSASIEDNYETIGESAMYYIDGGVMTIIGTGTVDGHRVPTEIKKELNTLVIDEGITEIGHSSFWACKKLKKVVLPNSLREIDDYAFNSCAILSEINLPYNLTSTLNNY